MGNEEATAQKISEGLKDTLNHIGNMGNLFNDTMQNLIAKSVQKNSFIEIVEKKGWFGVGRKIKKIKITAHISMNNVLVIDFSDKAEMKEYFDGLK